MRILGISAFYHDSAAALIEDGKILAAAQEERFTRHKHDASFPAQAAAWTLSRCDIDLGQVDCVVFYEKPFVRFERLLETYVAFAPRGFRSFRTAIPRWVKDKLFMRQQLSRSLRCLPGGDRWNGELLFSNHHLSHAAAAYYPSPFDDAVILTVDGVGEWATTTLSVGDGNIIQPLRELHFPHSIGLLYSTITTFLGFKVNSGEYKVMGLAPYGVPRFTDLMQKTLIDIKEDGSFRLDMSYFSFATELKMAGKRMEMLFGIPSRQPEGPLKQIHMDIAASLQQLTEVIMLKLARFAAKETGKKNLCLAGGVALNCVANGKIPGGVALNCVANGKIRRDGCFDDIWVQPASGDAGSALGAALAAYHLAFSGARKGRKIESTCYLGPAYDQNEVIQQLTTLGAKFSIVDETELIQLCASDLANGKVLGWMQGCAEFGPRALGNRSILADPRPIDAQRTLNLKIKFRESFRPFAPSVLSEHAADWFDIDHPSPYMAFVAPIKENSKHIALPAVTHLDGSARLQSVSCKDNPLFHALLSRFASLTDCPVLVNTSFNVRGEPMVLTPADAFACFMGTDIDRLAIGNCYLRKEDQTQTKDVTYAAQFAPD